MTGVKRRQEGEFDEFVLTDLSLRESAFKVYSVDGLNKLGQERDRTVAVLLSCIPSFYDDILSIRGKLSIIVKPIADIAKNKQGDKRLTLDMPSFGDAAYHHSSDPELLGEVRKVLSRYKLSERWLDAVLTLVHNDAVVLPSKNAITVNLSDDPMYLLQQQRQRMRRIDEARKQSAAAPDRDILRTLSLLSKPRRGAATPKIAKFNHSKQFIIAVNERMSTTELALWIKGNKGMKIMLDKLEKTPYSRLGRQSDSSLYWGHHVWAYKEFINKNHSMVTIEKWLDSNLPERTDIPDGRELDIYYKRFLKARDKFIP